MARKKKRTLASKKNGKLGWNVESICQICDQNKESVFNAFSNCYDTKDPCVTQPYVVRHIIWYGGYASVWCCTYRVQ